MTIGELIGRGERLFVQADIQLGQGTLTARDESRWLVLATLGRPVDSPNTVESEALSADQQQRVLAVFERRIRERLPAAYITGRAWLKGYEFMVDKRVIIPRSFIAELLMQRLQPFWTHPDPPERLFDLCTGSGCLAIIAAAQFPSARITAADISPDALAVAADNLKFHGQEGRIKLLTSDVFAGLNQEPSGAFDVIIANPPYVPRHKEAGLPPEFKAEPRLALIAADRGMAIVRQILAHAAQFMTDRGLLIVEVGHERRACAAMMRSEFSGLRPHWIRTEEQFDNVFVITKAQLIEHPWRPRS